MPSRVWLAAAFVIAFGASPAQAGMQTAAGKLLDVHPAETVAALQNRLPRLSCARKPDGASAAEIDDPRTSAEKRAHVAAAD